MKLMLANPRGFCAGVDRAIDIVNRALEVFGAPIYVRHEVVHNKFVVETLKERGAIFVDELSEIPDDVIVIFSAHGVSQAVRQEAVDRGLKVFDATCPLVTKVHHEVKLMAGKDYDIIYVGHEGHDEAIGAIAEAPGAAMLVDPVDGLGSFEPDDPDKVAAIRDRLGLECDLQPIPTSAYPTPAARPLNSRMDAARLEQTFGLAMPSWDADLQRCLADP